MYVLNGPECEALVREIDTKGTSGELGAKGGALAAIVRTMRPSTPDELATAIESVGLFDEDQIDLKGVSKTMRELAQTTAVPRKFIQAVLESVDHYQLSRILGNLT